MKWLVVLKEWLRSTKRSKGCELPIKETWRWNEEVRATIRLKSKSYRSLAKYRNNVTYENYKVARRESKKGNPRG